MYKTSLSSEQVVFEYKNVMYVLWWDAALSTINLKVYGGEEYHDIKQIFRLLQQINIDFRLGRKADCEENDFLGMHQYGRHILWKLSRMVFQ